MRRRQEPEHHAEAPNHRRRPANSRSQYAQRIDAILRRSGRLSLDDLDSDHLPELLDGTIQ
jgi:hypothetical protein